MRQLAAAVGRRTGCGEGNQRGRGETPTALTHRFANRRSRVKSGGKATEANTQVRQLARQHNKGHSQAGEPGQSRQPIHISKHVGNPRTSANTAAGQRGHGAVHDKSVTRC